MFLNLVISKSATKYQNSSTMANGIGWAHKIDKQNRQWPGITNDPSNASLSTSHRHDKFNENIDISSEESLSTYTHSSTSLL